MEAVECLALFIGGVDRSASHRQERLPVLLRERQHVENLERPLVVEKRSTSDARVLIGERVDEDEPLRRGDLAIEELSPHLVAVGRGLAVLKDAAWMELDARLLHLNALRT